MFRPVAFDPHGTRRRARRGVPRWLVLLAAGVLAGAGGLFFVQQRYLPPRLSAEETVSLKASFEQADAQRRQLQQALADTTRQLDEAKATRDKLSQELQASRKTVDHMREDIGALAAALPPDPRGGPVQVRAARFSAEGGKLLYDVVLSRERGASQPLKAVMQLVVAGAARKGADASVRLEPVSLTMNAVESLRGGAALPDGFDARQATIHVLDRPGGKLLGMRVIVVK